MVSAVVHFSGQRTIREKIWKAIGSPSGFLKKKLFRNIHESGTTWFSVSGLIVI
jgi:hypothetical protein